MIWRNITLLFAKYVAILLCLFTILLTTPWGTQLTLALLNNIDGLTLDYHDGSLVRDVELTVFHLQLDNIDIEIKGLSTDLDFSCLWKKTLCINSLQADKFSLIYSANDKSVTRGSEQVNSRKSVFKMPFAITANTVEIKESYLKINDTEIFLQQFISQLSIKENNFLVLTPSAQQLTVIPTIHDKEAPITTQASNAVSGDYSLDIISSGKASFSDFFSANVLSANMALDHPFSDLAEIDLPIALTIEQLTVADIVVATKKKPIKDCKQHCLKEQVEQWHSTNNQLSAAWFHTDVSVSDFKTSTADFSITQFSAKAKLQPPYQVNSEFISEIKELSWWPEISHSTQQISLDGAFDGLAFVINSKGSLALTSYGKVNLIDSDMPFDITLDAPKLPLPLALTDYAKLSSLALTLSGNLQKQRLELTSQVNSYGYTNAKIQLELQHKQGQFDINKLVFNDEISASHLTLSGVIALIAEDISWEIAAESSGFTLPKIKSSDLFALITQEKTDDLAADNLEVIPSSTPEIINGRLQGYIASTGTWSPQQWTASISDSNIVAQINNADLIIKGGIGLKQSSEPFWHINGELSVDNINQWYRGINGAFSGEFSIMGAKENPVISLNNQFHQLNWQHYYSDMLTTAIRYQPMNLHQVELMLTNETLKVVNKDNVVEINDFTLSITGNAEQHQIKTHWLGDTRGKFTLVGNFNENFSHWQAEVEKSTIVYKKFVLQNDKTFVLGLDINKQQAVIASHCWQGEGINLCLAKQTIIGETGDVELQLALDLTKVDELILPAEIELNSQITGAITANWSKSKPITAKAKFILSPGAIKVHDEFNVHSVAKWSQGNFTFTLDEQQFNSEIQLSDKFDKTLMNINASIDFIDDYPVKAKVVLNDFNLQPLQALSAEVVNLQGYVTADVTLNGTLHSPLLNGKLSLEKGKLQLSQNANTLNNISSELVIENNQASVASRFFLAEQEANLSGVMSWQNSLKLNLDFNGSALPLVFPPQLQMSVSPQLNFSLTDKTLTVSGNIAIVDGHYNIEKLSEGRVSLSDDVVIVDQQGQVLVDKSTGYDIKTNIRVNIAQAFTVSGQGLQSQLTGELQVSQKEKQPLQFFGRVQSYEGTFQAYGQKLNIEKGELSFNGPINNPYFNIRATRHIKAEDIDVGIQVTGLADELSMQLFSTPTMEMPEIVSYLARGRSLDSGTSNSAAAASLLLGFGVTNSFGLFDQIEKIPLISNIAVDTEGEGEQTQATVSGYVGNRIYLKYGIGVYEPINELTVRMYMFNRFWLEIVSGIEYSTDLYYSFDID